MTRILFIGSIGLALLVFIGSQCVFFVDERERAIVLQLGKEIEDDARKPGLNFKLPFIQNAMFFENRIMVFEIAKTESLTSDMKVIEIDNYVCWRIEDPLLFYRAMRTERDAEIRLHSIVDSQLRAGVGSRELNEVVYHKRKEIMEEVLQRSNLQAGDYGVSIVDVRMKRTDLPNRPAIFKRMNAERERIANRYRSEGQSENRRIRSEAEMEQDIILADAKRQSTVIRGKAEAEAIRIFAAALSAAPEFYAFSKSLEVYRKAFKENTRIVLSNDDPLLEYFR